MKDLPGLETFRRIEPITKGLSGDEKYRVETLDDRRMLLRLADPKEYDRKKTEYEMMKRAYEHGVRTSRPYAFGLCDGGRKVYALTEWLEGEDAESALPRMSETEQYGVGLKAGAVLRKIHTLPAPDDAGPWDVRFRDKVKTRVRLYHENGLESADGERILQYLRDKQSLLTNRPQTFWHGDFSVGNQMLLPDGEIGVIDFNDWNYDYGDPWWEFVVIPWGEEPTACYFTGMINGYFGGAPPLEFFELLSYYFACDALSALCYTFLGLEPCTAEDGRRHMENVLRWFGDMKRPVPTWYRTDLAREAE